MCGRFTLTTPAEELGRLFGADPPPDLAPRYNVAPTQPILAVRAAADGPGRHFGRLRWGLIPSWAAAADTHKTALMNARAEMIAVNHAQRQQA